MTYQRNMAGTAPFVSVIIPAYNAAETIDGTLNAVLKQTYPKDRFEVIVVNDGSSDKTCELALQYQVTVISHSRNLGPNAARNSGADQARGEILAFTDADDKLDRDWLSNLVNAYKDDVNVGCVVGSTHVILSKRNFQERIIGELFLCLRGGERITSRDIYDKRGSIARGKSVGPNISFSRNAFLKIGGYDASVPAGEEYDIIWRIEQAGYKLKFEEGAVVYKHQTRTTFHKYLKEDVYRRAGKSTVFLSKHFSKMTLRDFLTILYFPLVATTISVSLILSLELLLCLGIVAAISPLSYYSVKALRGRRYITKESDTLPVIIFGSVAFVIYSLGTTVGWCIRIASLVRVKLKAKGNRGFS